MTCKENKLMIYFLVDCSNAMSGKLIEKARTWIKYFRDDYSNDPTSLECTRFSIITFESLVRQIVPPTKLMNFQVPRLQTNGNSAVLGEALRVLKDCINRDVGYGGWKPIVYLFCKSMPTDKEIFFQELGDIRAFTDEHHIFAYYEEPDDDYCGELAYILDNITGNLILMDSEIPVVSYYPEKYFDLPWTTQPINSNSPPWPIFTPCKESVYLLIDCSSSMSGKPINIVKKSIETLLSGLKNPYCSCFGKVYLSVITFSSSARQVTPLTGLLTFQTPQLQIGGSANLEEAFRVLKDCIRLEIIPNTKERKGDWKPYVFLFTTGSSTNQKIFSRKVNEFQTLADMIAFAMETFDEINYLEHYLTVNTGLFELGIGKFHFGDNTEFLDKSDTEVNPLVSSNKNLNSKGEIVLKSNIRKLPIYLLIDCSSSMSGKPIEKVKQGIKDFVSYLKGDPQALETAYFSVITFSSSARQVTPLTGLLTFRMPQLQIGGSANLEEAFRVLKDCIQLEIIPNTKELRGDWKPHVFLFTTGSSTNQRIFARKVNEFQTSADMVAFATETFETSEMITSLECGALGLNTSGGFIFIIGKFHFGNINESLDKSDTEVNPLVSSNKNFNGKGEVIMESYVRRLPVYLLLDCSGSMSGEPIEAVRQGINTLLSDLKGDPQALETAYLSVITFDSTAQQVVPLTELMSFNPPELHASGLTSMGGALRVLKDCVQRELLPNTEEHKGDWKPLVFLLTDGNPTDGEVLRSELQDMSSLHAANIIACAAGPCANTTVLKQITPNVLMMNSTSAGDMAKFFAWVSSSIGISSKSVSEKPGEAFTLPPPPQGFTVVP